MAKEDNKDTQHQTQTPEQDMYYEYVKGANAQTLGEKYQLDPLAVLAIIQSIQASKAKR